MCRKLQARRADVIELEGKWVSRKVEEDGALRCVIAEVTFKRAQRKMRCLGHTSPTHPGACVRTPAALRPLGARVINTHVSTPRPVRAAGSEMKTTRCFTRKKQVILLCC